MELYKYDNYFSFNLSDNYKILKSKNFANNELINVHSGKYFTEQEEEKYKYAYTLKTLNLEFAEGVNQDNILINYLNNNFESFKYVEISKQPQIILASLAFPYFNTKALTKNIRLLSSFIHLEENKVLSITGDIIFNTIELDFNLEDYLDFFNLINSIEYRGNSFEITKSVDLIKKHLDISAEERYAAWMFTYEKHLNKNLKFQFNNKIYTIISNGFSESKLKVQLNEKGANLNNLLNENTDYLIVNPYLSEPDIIEKALSIKEEYQDLEIVLLESLELELGLISTASNNIDLDANIEKTISKTNKQNIDHLKDSDKSVDKFKEFEENITDLSNIVKEADKEGLSINDIAIIEKTKKELNKFQQGLEETIEAQEQNKQYEEDRKLKEEEKRKAKEKELEIKKHKILTKADVEKFKIDMFVTLKNEEKVDMLERTDEDFIKTYKDDFFALSDEEMITVRSEMLVNILNKETSEYFNGFKNYSTYDKYKLSTQNLLI